VERTLGVHPADCPELPQTIALLVESWLQHLPSLGDAPARAPAADEAPEPGVRPARPPTATPGPAGVEPRPVAPSKTEASGDVASDGAPGPPAEVPVDHLRVMLSGGLSFASTFEQRVFRGLARVDGTLANRWGLALEGGLEPGLRVAAGPGTISVSAATLSLLGRVTVWPTAWGGVDLLAGAGVEYLVASSGGYAVNREVGLWNAGLWAAADGRVRIIGRLYATISVAVHGRLRREAFEIEGLGPVLLLSPLRLSAVAGLGMALF
jgi:hypothetical protein